MLAEKLDNEQKEIEYVISENESRERHNTEITSNTRTNR